MRKLSVVLVALLALAGCGGQGAKEISETRTAAPPPAPAPAQDMPAGHDMGMKMPPADGTLPPGHPSVSPYKWQVPEGWSEAPATSMRIGNFKIAASPDAECYLTLLKGTAGGVDANINRWSRQMGQADLKPEEIAALPKVDVLGQPAPLAEINGSFTGMAGQQFTDYSLLGTVVTLTEETLFVKMTGPAAVIKAEKEHFLSFCKSLASTVAAGDATAKEKQNEGEAAGNAGVQANK